MNVCNGVVLRFVDEERFEASDGMCSVYKMNTTFNNRKSFY